MITSNSSTICNDYVSNYTNDLSNSYITTATTSTATINWQDYLNSSVQVTTTPDYHWTNVGQTTPLTEWDVRKIIEDINKEKDKETMANNFDFGSYKTDSIRISTYGMAIKNKSGKWVSYDKNTHRLMDVDILNFEIDSSKIFYKIPKAVEKIIPGDVILHNNRPMFVEALREDGKFEVIDPVEGTAITILAPVSPFGFTYLTQIACLMDALPEASNENPFGSFLPFILSSDGNNNLPLMMMLMGNDFDLDPITMMALAGKSDMAMLFLLQQRKKKKSKRKVKSYDNDDTLEHFRAMYGPGIEDSDE